MPKKDEHDLEEVIAPLLATAAAVMMYVAVEEGVYEAWKKWSIEHVEAPPGMPPPKPPSRKALAMSAALTIKIARDNMTLSQQAMMMYAQYLAEGGAN